jgi:hypothetical protein
VRLAIALLLASLLPAGCSTSAPEKLTIDDAQGRYPKVLSATAKRLTSQTGVIFTVVRHSTTQRFESRCLYETDTLGTSSRLGVEIPWVEVIRGLEPALSLEGFEDAVIQDVPGGHTGFDATDRYGAVLMARAKVTSTLVITAEVRC